MLGPKGNVEFLAWLEVGDDDFNVENLVEKIV